MLTIDTGVAALLFDCAAVIGALAKCGRVLLDWRRWKSMRRPDDPPD